MTEMLRILPYNSVTFDKGIVIGDAYDVRVMYARVRHTEL